MSHVNDMKGNVKEEGYGSWKDAHVYLKIDVNKDLNKWKQRFDFVLWFQIYRERSTTMWGEVEKNMNET